mgnify:CR=1 FL=1
MAQVEESLLDTLKRAIDTNTIKDKARTAGNWFRTVVKRAKGNLSGQTPEKMISGFYKYIVFEKIEKSTGKVYDEPCHKIMKKVYDLPNTDWVAQNHWCVPIYHKGNE